MTTPARNVAHWLSPEGWASDFRQALRTLGRAPGFTAAVFCSLVVCIGPNAAILSALYSLVLKPLPFPQPGQLVSVFNVAEKNSGQVLQSSMSQYRDFKTRADRFSGYTGVIHSSAILDDDTAPVRVYKDMVTVDFFEVLGVQSILGRFFTPEESVPGQDNVVVLSEEYWAGHYRGDPQVLGRQVRMNGRNCTIVGVAPRSLASLYRQTNFFQPYAPAAARFDPQLRYRGDIMVYARLKPDVSLSAGVAQLAALESDFQRNQAPAQIKDYIAQAGFRVSLAPLHTGGIVAEKTTALWVLQGSALFVLLIGLVNVTNLFLARMNAKRTDLSIRVSLGAGRSALLRLLLAESFLLTGGSAIAGIGFASVSLRVFNRYLPVLVQGAPPVTLDATVVVAVIAVAFAIALLVGFVPLQLLWRSGLRLDDSRTTSSTGGTRFASSILVTSQVAIAVVLLIGSSLLIRSFTNVLAVDPGFEATRVVQGRLNMPKHYVPVATLNQRYSDPMAAANVTLQRRIVEALKTIPGVEEVAESLDPVLDPNIRPVPFATRGAADAQSGGQPLIHIAAVSPRFFAAMGMRVQSGRDFDDGDDFSKKPVAIVDEAFVRSYFSGRLVEGQEIYLNKGLPLAEDGWARIIGVVNHIKVTGLDSNDKLPMVFVPMVGYPTNGFGVLVRSARNPADLGREMRTKLHEVDPALPLHSTESLQDGLDDLLMGRRGITLLLGFFSATALLLAAIGLYGVLSYDVTQRTREIGIRSAIGASRGEIIGLILRQGAGKTGAGLIIGLVGAILLSRQLNTLLYGISASDPLSYVVVVAILSGVALLACWLPALRAASVDPIIALRME